MMRNNTSVNINELLETNLDFNKVDNLYKLLKIRSIMFYRSLGDALSFNFSQDDAEEQFIKNFEHVYSNTDKHELINRDLIHIRNKFKEL
jgi:hypothetical protein